MKFTVADHIINLVTSRVVFDLLVAAGMDANPPSSISYVNGEVKVSNTTDGCRFYNIYADRHGT
jgi:hypothetical protein